MNHNPTNHTGILAQSDWTVKIREVLNVIEWLKAGAHIATVLPKFLERFFINAARKEVRQIRARQLREEYERTHRRRTPREIYEKTLAEVVAFETRYPTNSYGNLRPV